MRHFTVQVLVRKWMPVCSRLFVFENSVSFVIFLVKQATGCRGDLIFNTFGGSWVGTLSSDTKLLPNWSQMIPNWSRIAATKTSNIVLKMILEWHQCAPKFPSKLPPIIYTCQKMLTTHVNNPPPPTPNNKNEKRGQTKNTQKRWFWVDNGRLL